MRAICKQITSQGFDLNEVTTVFSNDHDYSVNGYGIELNKEYIVMGIATYRDSPCLYYLISVNGKPEWYPYLLFEITDNTLRSEWFINISGSKSVGDVYSVYGFYELCNEPAFYDQLSNREDNAMSIFFKHLMAVEEELAKSKI